MSGLDHRLEPPDEVRRFEVITGVLGRRRWTPVDRARIIAETLEPGAVVSQVARRYGLRPQQLFTWHRDTSERLDVVPAQFRVLVTHRPKYACRSCEEVVVQAPAPTRLIEGGIPTEATVAHVLVSKYADHLPLYRQAQIYARQGVRLDRSTWPTGSPRPLSC